ncbi:MAG: NUDIX domain-containing protein [Prolixibacteraceae bacterium]|nr:NUDIX domain-containing protein [Prolixibacteraceae bacterium]
MNRADILKKLLPGFIPLFVFILADEIWGTTVGIIVAVIVGVAEFLWVWIQEHRFDKFILFDTLLLIILGGISLILQNDIFFKIKPGLIELILVTILGISAFSHLNIVGLMSKRYMKGIEMNDLQVRQMRKSLKFMFYMFTIHTALVFYSAFYMSNEAWAFISGGLFYILFGVYFVFELIKNKLKQKKQVMSENVEWLPVVNEKGEITGKAPRSVVHGNEKILHPVVHMHVIGKNKTILLQKRPLTKLAQPGKWDTAVGGHITFNEKLEEALKREAFEEIGLKDFSARLINVFKWETETEAELVYLFVTFDSKGIHVNNDEVDEVRFWTLNQIQRALKEDILTPHLDYEINFLKHAGIL